MQMPCLLYLVTGAQGELTAELTSEILFELTGDGFPIFLELDPGISKVFDIDELFMITPLN